MGLQNLGNGGPTPGGGDGAGNTPGGGAITQAINQA